jgi:hypothetical protein
MLQIHGYHTSGSSDTMAGRSLIALQCLRNASLLSSMVPIVFQCSAAREATSNGCASPSLTVSIVGMARPKAYPSSMKQFDPVHAMTKHYISLPNMLQHGF